MYPKIHGYTILFNNSSMTWPLYWTRIKPNIWTSDDFDYRKNKSLKFIVPQEKFPLFVTNIICVLKSENTNLNFELRYRTVKLIFNNQYSYSEWKYQKIEKKINYYKFNNNTHEYMIPICEPFLLSWNSQSNLNLKFGVEIEIKTNDECQNIFIRFIGRNCKERENNDNETNIRICYHKNPFLKIKDINDIYDNVY
jgi:hypothetical protein